MSTSITTTSTTATAEQKLLKQLEPLFSIQNKRIDKIEYCMYGVNNANWLNENIFHKNIPIYFIVRQNTSKIEQVEKELTQKFLGIEETANTAFSDTRSIEPLIQKKVDDELKKVKSSLDDEFKKVKTSFGDSMNKAIKENQDKVDKNVQMSKTKIDERLQNNKKRIDQLEKAVLLLEKVPAKLDRNSPVKFDKQTSPDKMTESTNKQVQKQIIKDECGKILTDLMKNYCKKNEVEEVKKKFTELSTQLKLETEKTVDLEKRLNCQEKNVKFMTQMFKTLGNKNILHLIFIRDSIEKIINDILDTSDGTLFRDPVTEHIAPHYFDVIKDPICLLDMKKKNSEGFYKTIQMFITDFNLMITNCKNYNFPDINKPKLYPVRTNEKVLRPMVERTENMFFQKINELKKLQAKEVQSWPEPKESQNCSMQNSPAPKPGNENSHKINNNRPTVQTPLVSPSVNNQRTHNTLTNILSNPATNKVGPEVQISPDRTRSNSPSIHANSPHQAHQNLALNNSALNNSSKRPLLPDSSKRPLLPENSAQSVQDLSKKISIVSQQQNKILETLGISISDLNANIDSSPSNKKARIAPPPYETNTRRVLDQSPKIMLNKSSERSTPTNAIPTNANISTSNSPVIDTSVLKAAVAIAPNPESNTSANLKIKFDSNNNINGNDLDLTQQLPLLQTVHKLTSCIQWITQQTAYLDKQQIIETDERRVELKNLQNELKSYKPGSFPEKEFNGMKKEVEKCTRVNDSLIKRHRELATEFNAVMEVLNKQSEVLNENSVKCTEIESRSNKIEEVLSVNKTKMEKDVNSLTDKIISMNNYVLECHAVLGGESTNQFEARKSSIPQNLNFRGRQPEGGIYQQVLELRAIPFLRQQLAQQREQHIRMMQAQTQPHNRGKEWFKILKTNSVYQIFFTNFDLFFYSKLSTKHAKPDPTTTHATTYTKPDPTTTYATTYAKPDPTATYSTFSIPSK